MGRRNESKFEYGVFHEPASLGTHEPAVMDLHAEGIKYLGAQHP
jgi:hypothetical protein